MRLEDLKGRRFGRYEIIDLLGRGGMAAVYRAHDTVLRRDVALKVLYPQFSGDNALVERFMREAVLSAGLDHPNILPIYDVGEADGLVYIAMKLLSGRSFADVLRVRGSLPLRELAPIVEQVAAALDYAHARRIVHRDIKPANILVDGMGASSPNPHPPSPIPHVYLTDFGIAKSLDPLASGLTATGVLIGTPEFMAPEQIRGSRDVDERADIYALGVLVYRALTGQRPFEGGTQEVLMGHLQGKFTDPSQLDPSLPPAIDQLVRVALARDPNQRYRSAGQLARALSAAAGQAPATPPTVRRESDGRTVVPQAAMDETTYRGPIRPDDATRKGTAAPPGARAVAPRAVTPAPPIERGRGGGVAWAILGLLLAGLIGGGLLFASGLLTSNRGGGTVGDVATATATASPPAERSPEPTQPTEIPPTAAPSPTAAPPPPTGQPTEQPSATSEPTAKPTIPPTRAPTAIPRPTSTSTPTTAPTDTPTPAPTDTPTATPCPQPLQSGFGMLWEQNQVVRDRIGCPLSPEAGGDKTITEQQFEHGSMFYFQPNDRIYVLIGRDIGTWRLFRRSDIGDLPTPTPADPPPCSSPMDGGFALVWSTQQDVHDALGCSTAPMPNLFDGAFQPFEHGTMLYSRIGLGRGKSLYVLYADNTFARYDDPNQ